MPKVRLYNQDVRFHISPSNPFWLNSAAVRNHVAWNYISPKVWFRVYNESPANNFPGDWNKIADNFALAGLTGSNGETNAASWAFVAGATAHNIGRGLAYVADMYRAFYASRGISHDGRYAWWPQGAAQAGYEGNIFPADARQWALFPHVSNNTVGAHGATSDYLNISSWTGATTSQLAVQANTPYLEGGLSAFTQWVQHVADGLSAGLSGRANVAAPAILAGDFEESPVGASNRLWFNNGIEAEEIGSWQQMLNDPRALTYKFFDRHTLFELWGATGGSAQWGRSPHQWSVPFTLTAANDASNAITVPSRPVDVIWERRSQALDYAPSFYNFFSSLQQRHKEHLWSRGFQPLRNAFPGTIIGNYQNIPSTKRIPNRDPGGKIHAFNYTCDLGCTGPAGATLGYNDASVTGTFSLDYAAPVIYPPVPNGVKNWLPGIGYFFVISHYSGSWGTSPVSPNGSGIFATVGGSPLATYVNFLQHCSKQGMTGISGGGTAEGYTGGNITDLRNYWFANSKQLLATSRGALDSFNDNSSKPVIPWIGNASETILYHSIFSLTASSSAPYFADANGITNYTLGQWEDPVALDFNVAIIKYAIQTHNITDFFVFEPSTLFGEALALQALDFWNDVVQTLLIDSGPAGNTVPVARINVSPATTVRDTNGSGSETLIASGLSSSDADGDALLYAWTTSNGLSASGATANFSFPIGSHTIYLTVADITGATGATSVAVTVLANTAPHAQIDVSPSTSVRDNDNNGIENFVFSGAGSSDQYGGTIAQYAWTIDGATGATGVTAGAGLTVGSHTVTLLVADNGGATASTSVTVTVLEYLERERITSEYASMIYFGGRIYTREEFDYILKTFYGIHRK